MRERMGAGVRQWGVASVVVAFLASSLGWADSALAEVVPVREGPSASASITPGRLPRTKPAPVTLQMGFDTNSAGGPTPELTRIGFKLSRAIMLDTTGLRSCPLPDLLYPTLRYTCGKSLIGQGSVTSEITLPRQAPVTVTGHLSAYYSYAYGEPRILAQVTTGEPLPLIYVIPFTLHRTRRPFGTRLGVAKMRLIRGKCRNPCGSYSLQGVYSHISDFSMSLHREFAYKGHRRSFVSAICPARGLFSPLLEADLSYSTGERYAEKVARPCTPSG